MNMPNDKRRTLDDILDEFYELSGDEKHKLISEILSNSNIDLSSMQRILESMQRAFEHIAKPLTQFAANFSLERGIRGMILKVAEDRLQSGKLNENDVSHLTEQRDEFQSRFDSIIGTSDNPERIDILFAILSAFAIGLHSEVSESVIRELSAELGKKSGENRRIEAEEGWRDHALKLAITIRKEDRGITQIKLAAEIKLRWKLCIHCPESMLIPAISQWEREDKLARRSK